jgi:hypothetical protein
MIRPAPGGLRVSPRGWASHSTDEAATPCAMHFAMAHLEPSVENDSVAS